jgi:hypothetical protein
MPVKYVPYTYKLTDLRVDATNIDPDSGIELVEDKFVVSNAWSDITIVENEIWGFRRSDAEGDNGIGSLYIIDQDHKKRKTLTHNFGHCNTVDYCSDTDSLIFGNGSGVYDTNGYIYIIQGVKAWKELAENTLLDIAGITGSIITTISVLRVFGDKVNVCWGEDNNDQHNICYVMSNDNETINKLLLGQGANNLGAGQFVAGRDTDEFNGTYKIIGTWTAAELDVNQGSCYYNGAIYTGIGHNGLWAAKYKLNDDGTASIEQKHETYYTAAGELVTDTATEGIAINNGMVYHGVYINTGSTINYVYKYKAF